jgi:hypothetical protein
MLCSDLEDADDIMENEYNMVIPHLDLDTAFELIEKIRRSDTITWIPSGFTPLKPAAIKEILKPNGEGCHLKLIEEPQLPKVRLSSVDA